jgi:hypothetical protein
MYFRNWKRNAKGFFARAEVTQAALNVLQMGHCIITWFNGVRH